MNLSHQIQVELVNSQFQDFNEFLSCHGKVNSFQRINGVFHIHVVHQDNEEYSAFVNGIKDSFHVEEIRETKLCKSHCRDGTPCLNPAHGNELCFKHNNSN